MKNDLKTLLLIVLVGIFLGVFACLLMSFVLWDVNILKEMLITIRICIAISAFIGISVIIVKRISTGR